MTLSNKIKGKGPIIGAFFLSGCTQSSTLNDTFFVVTRPLDLATSLMILAVLILAAWWCILRLAHPQPRRLFLTTMCALVVGMILVSLPTLSLVTGVIWPSLVIILELAAIGGGLLGVVGVLTAGLFVWRLIAAVIDRL